MQLPVLEIMFRHNLWANLTLLQYCTSLNQDQLQTTLVGGYGSIEETFRHLVNSERSYLARISTGQRLVIPKNEAPMNFDEMAASLQRTGEGFIEWAPKVATTDEVEIQWNSDDYQGVVMVPKAIILNQVINHATEHRAQIMATLTQLGIEPPELSSWVFFEQKELVG